MTDAELVAKKLALVETSCREVREMARIDADLSAALQRMAGFRNVLVHGYADVDLAIVEDAARTGLADLERFAAAIRARF